MRVNFLSLGNNILVSLLVLALVLVLALALELEVFMSFGGGFVGKRNLNTVPDDVTLPVAVEATEEGGGDAADIERAEAEEEEDEGPPTTSISSKTIGVGVVVGKLGGCAGSVFMAGIGSEVIFLTTDPAWGVLKTIFKGPAFVAVGVLVVVALLGVWGDVGVGLGSGGC